MNNFYQSSSYKKLLLELEWCGGQNPEAIDIDSNMQLNLNFDTGSDSNSGDLPYDDDIIDEVPNTEFNQTDDNKLSGNGGDGQFLDVANFKHSRSHSDCTGLQSLFDMGENKKLSTEHMDKSNSNSMNTENARAKSAPTKSNNEPSTMSAADNSTISMQHKLSAKIINTAIHCEGQYAVYAIQVSVIDGNHQKCWHIYRRYSRFLELKKLLVKKVSIVQEPMHETSYFLKFLDLAIHRYKKITLTQFVVSTNIQNSYL